MINYYDHPALCRSKLAAINISPYYFWSLYIAKTIDIDSIAMKFGRAFHNSALEPQTFDNNFVVEPEYKTKKECGLSITEQKLAFSQKNRGKGILTQKENRDLLFLLTKLQNRTPAMKLLNSCNQKEVEYFFKLEGLDFKAKIDAVNETASTPLVIDLKTSASSSPNEFSRSVVNYHYAEQVFLYSYAVEQKIGVRPIFLFINICKKEPNEVIVYDASCFYDHGKYQLFKQIEKYNYCVERWGLCLDTPWEANDTDAVIKLELPLWINNNKELQQCTI